MSTLLDPAPTRIPDFAPATPARRPRRRGRIAAAAVAAGLVGLVGAAEVALPGIAAERVRADLAASGDVTEVKVAAFPAVKLLWGDADEVTVRMGSYRSEAGGQEESGDGGGGLGDALAETRGIDKLDVRVDALSVAPLMLRDVRLTKRGAELDVRAAVSEQDLRAALPPELSLRPVSASEGLTLDATVSALGFEADAAARLVAEDGRLVIRPDDVPFEDLASVTVFADERVSVTDVSTEADAGGYGLRARARIP